MFFCIDHWIFLLQSYFKQRLGNCTNGLAALLFQGTAAFWSNATLKWGQFLLDKKKPNQNFEHELFGSRWQRLSLISNNSAQWGPLHSRSSWTLHGFLALPGVHNLDYTKWDLKKEDGNRHVFFVLCVFFFLPALVGVTATVMWSFWQRCII